MSPTQRSTSLTRGTSPWRLTDRRSAHSSESFCHARLSSVTPRLGQSSWAIDDFGEHEWHLENMQWLRTRHERSGDCRWRIRRAATFCVAGLVCRDDALLCAYSID